MNLIKMILIGIWFAISLNWGHADEAGSHLKMGSEFLTRKQMDELFFAPGNDYLTLTYSYKQLTQHSIFSICHALKSKQQNGGSSQEDIDIQQSVSVLIKSV